MGRRLGIAANRPCICSHIVFDLDSAVKGTCELGAVVDYPCRVVCFIGSSSLLNVKISGWGVVAFSRPSIINSIVFLRHQYLLGRGARGVV